MTRKDYVAIAEAFKEAMDARELQRDTAEALECLGQRLAIYFKQDNPRFEKIKFFQACGLLEISNTDS